MEVATVAKGCKRMQGKYIYRNNQSASYCTPASIGYQMCQHKLGIIGGIYNAKQKHLGCKKGEDNQK